MAAGLWVPTAIAIDVSEHIRQDRLGLADCVSAISAISCELRVAQILNR